MKIIMMYMDYNIGISHILKTKIKNIDKLVT
jgi:hypothetical protein